MSGVYVPGCPHHAYFRFMAPVYDWTAPRWRGSHMRPVGHRAACVACDNGLSDEVARHHLEDALARGTAEPDGILR